MHRFMASTSSWINQGLSRAGLSLLNLKPRASTRVQKLGRHQLFKIAQIKMFALGLIDDGAIAIKFTGLELL